MPLEYALQHREQFAPANPWKNPVPTQRVALEPNAMGISHLAKQSVKVARKRPFKLNIMVVGESGLGKTTFINTLFASDLLSHGNKVISALEEEGVNVDLTIVDTPGFGDQINRETSIEPIISYLDAQYEKYNEDETHKGFRKALDDHRIHALLYFISPNCHHLKEFDINSLKVLSSKVNVIPIIAKADTLTSEEKAELKARILDDLSKYDLKLYPTAYCEDRDEIEHLEAHQPFCVIGADKFLDSDGKKVRGRKYRWGIAEVENDKHCDVVHLRALLLANNLTDLIETTHTVHYLNHRASKLRSDGRKPSILQSDEQYDFQLEQVKKQFHEEMARKEKDIREQIYRKVKEKEAELRDAEEALAKKEKELMADIAEQKKQLEAEEREIELAFQRSAATTKKKGMK